jgi:hypothetical protein
MWQSGNVSNSMLPRIKPKSLFAQGVVAKKLDASTEKAAAKEL